MAKIIKLRVGSKWNSMIAIREKYLEEALKTGSDIFINYPEGKLLIPFSEVNHFHTKTDKKFKDNFSNELHALVYYKIPKTGDIYGKKPIEIKKEEEVIPTIPTVTQGQLF